LPDKTRMKNKGRSFKRQVPARTLAAHRACRQWLPDRDGKTVSGLN